MNAMTRIVSILGLVSAIGITSSAEKEFGNADFTSEESTEMVIQGMAVMALQKGLLETARLPKTPAQWKDVEAACDKSPNTFYAWVFGQNALDVSLAEAKTALGGNLPADNWSSYADGVVKDHRAYCRRQLAAYAKARGEQNVTNKPKGKDKGEIAYWRSRWQEFRAKMAKEGRPFTEEARYPKNDAEQAELNAAGRKGMRACWKWIGIPDTTEAGPQEGWQSADGSRVSVDGVQECNEMAMQTQMSGIPR